MKRLKLPEIYNQFSDLVIIAMDGINIDVLLERFERDYPDCNIHLTTDPFDELWIKTPHLFVNNNGNIPDGLERVLYSIFVIKRFDVDGLTNEQKELYKSDWQALRDIERVMYQLYKDGKITLPESTVQLFKQREHLRDQVDAVINYNPVLSAPEPILKDIPLNAPRS